MQADQTVSGHWHCLAASHFVSFLSPGLGPLAPLVVRFTIGGVAPLLVFETDSECKD